MRHPLSQNNGVLHAIDAKKKQSLKIENWVSKRIGKNVYRISLNDNIKQNNLIKLG